MTSKIKLFVFWFIYSLHIKNIISSDIVIECLLLMNDVTFIESYSSSIKPKYQKYIETGIFPFKRFTNHEKHSYSDNV